MRVRRIWIQLYLDALFVSPVDQLIRTMNRWNSFLRENWYQVHLLGIDLCHFGSRRSDPVISLLPAMRTGMLQLVRQVFLSICLPLWLQKYDSILKTIPFAVKLTTLTDTWHGRIACLSQEDYLCLLSWQCWSVPGSETGWMGIPLNFRFIDACLPDKDL